MIKTLFFLISSFVIISSWPVFADTEVGGIIDNDTTWSLADSPYNITSTIQINEGITLTIEPGVVINGNGFIIEFFYHLYAIGSYESRIVFNNVHLVSGSNTISSFLHVVYALLNNSSIGICFGGNGSIIASDCIFQNYDSCSCYLGGPLFDSYIERNIFINTGGIEFDPRSDDIKIYIRNNVFYNHALDFSSKRAIFSISMYGPDLVIQNNSFLSTDRIALDIDSFLSSPLIASNNFWNTTDLTIIDSMILDRNDDLDRYATIDYQPILNSPHADTPNVPPFANAGETQEVYEEDTVTLSGDNSFDIDGGISRYYWEQISGTSVHLDSPDRISTTFSAPDVGENGDILVFSLTVTDNFGSAASDNCTITVNASTMAGEEKDQADSNKALALIGGESGGGCFISTAEQISNAH